MKNENQTPLTHHILPTSANLLGICFFILSYIKMGDKADLTLLDECVVFPIIIFFIASVLSYAAIRAEKNRPPIERMADFFFMIGLLSLSIISITLIFKLI